MEDRNHSLERHEDMLAIREGIADMGAGLVTLEELDARIRLCLDTKK